MHKSIVIGKCLVMLDHVQTIDELSDGSVKIIMRDGFVVNCQGISLREMQTIIEGLNKGQI